MATIRKGGFEIEVESIRKLILTNKNDPSKLPDWVKNAEKKNILFFDDNWLNMNLTSSTFSINSTSVLVKEKDRVYSLTSDEFNALFEEVTT